jgi:PAS domain S-box-containing protein
MKKDRVLIADDKEASRYLLRTLMESQGYEVDEAVHGAEALIKARQNPPILIISDLLMPVVDGYTLLRHWKADPQLKTIPFVVYTATYTDQKDEQLARDMGADDFILKPTEPEPFLARIKGVMAKAQRGQLSPVREPKPEKESLAKEYNEVLIAKLEEKALQLQEANRTLQRDIADRERMEAELAKSEDHLRSVVQTAADAIVTVDAQGRISLWNGAAETMFGFSSAEMIGQPLVRVLPERFRGDFQNRPQRRALTGQLILGQHPMEAVGLRRDGSEFPVEITISAWKVKEGSFSTAILRDISERKHAEEALRKSEAQLSNAAVIARLGPWEFDVEKDLFTFNDLFYAVFKTTAAEVGGYTLSCAEYAKRFVHPEDMDFVRAESERAIKSSDPNFSVTLEHRAVFADGTTGFISVRFFIVKDSNGKTVKTYGVDQDITDRKRAEEVIRRRLKELEGMNRVSTILRSESTLEKMEPRLLEEALALVESTTGAIWLLDPATGNLRREVARGWLADMKDTVSKPGEGFPGAVFGSNQVHVSEEFARDPDLRAAPRDSIPAGWGGAFFPIRSENEIVGGICIALEHPRKFTTEEVSLLVTISEMAGTATQRTLLHEQTKNQLKQLGTLHAIDTAITASMNLSVTLGYFLDQVIDILRIDAAAILLCDQRLMFLNYIAGKGFRGTGITSTHLRFGEGQSGRAALERRLIHSLISPQDPAEKPERIAGEGFITHIVVPLIAKGQVKGVLELFHRAPLAPDPEWLGFLKTLGGQAAIAIDNATLFTDLQTSNTKLSQAYDATLEGWSRAMDLRDKETEGHSERVTETTLRLARKMGITDKDLVHIHRGALLHDLGKLGVPDFILHKPGSLTDEEMAVMRRHPALANDLLMPIEYLRPALDIPYCHHERFDGSGYPRGLKSDQIPLAARIFAVADVYDALTSDRPYRPAWTREKTLKYIHEKSGTDFDPQVVEAFLQMQS